MRKFYKAFLILFLFLSIKTFGQIFCDSTGNVVIFSNYDGGVLNINVDVDIANLKIGVVSYENDSIIIGGPFVNNVTQVIFAGYYNSSNVHCSPWPSQKSINGVDTAITQIIFVPAVTYFNPYGYNYIICNTSCSDSTSQGGCNTPDQVADYFFNQFGSTALLFHRTQYGCWSDTYNLSGGGNCCSVPLSTGMAEVDDVIIKGEGRAFTIESAFVVTRAEVFDVSGRKILSIEPKSKHFDIDLPGDSGSMYFLKCSGLHHSAMKKIVVK
jgi:hypothetical protein